MSTGQVNYAKSLGASRSAKTDFYTRYRVLGSQKHPLMKCLEHKYTWKKKGIDTGILKMLVSLL